MPIYSFTHTYKANITHELTYELPDGLDTEQALAYISGNGIVPLTCEAVDEDVLDEGEWTDDTIRCPYCGSSNWIDADEGMHFCEHCNGEF